ncbi:unnamed protein product [Symbiodinium natans]|uniref:Methyltransferase domain-containing protein n=1 Tax=Symbiodinium natans TaxID=878477 RepID=A0A812H077_9DINO|nr:unnamed protein product [Symbiodinium natans]
MGRDIKLAFLLWSLLCCASDFEDSISADIAFVKNSWLWRRGLRLRHNANLFHLGGCWMHDSLVQYRNYPYNHCCCDEWKRSYRCWTETPATQPRQTFRYQCCAYLYGPGTPCLNRARDTRLQFPGLPVLKVRLVPSDFPYRSYFPNLLTEAHLLEPLHGQNGAPGPTLCVADIGAGNGVDSVALSLMGHVVVSLEQNARELQLLKANRMLNNVSFEIVSGDFTMTNLTAASLLEANGGQPFDVIVANSLTYLPQEVFFGLLDLVERVGTQDFVWLLICGREVYDLFDTQRANRELAMSRFELVDAVTFANVGNAFESDVQMGQVRVCALQRRGRSPNAWRYRWPRARAKEMVRRGAACKPPLWRCSADSFLSAT